MNLLCRRAFHTSPACWLAALALLALMAAPVRLIAESPPPFAFAITKPPQLAAFGWQIQGVAIDPAGNLYVAVYDSVSRVVMLSANGSYISDWVPTNTAGSFHGVPGIAVDSSTNIYLRDSYSSLLSKFTSDGRLLASWDLALGYVSGMAVDSRG